MQAMHALSGCFAVVPQSVVLHSVLQLAGMQAQLRAASKSFVAAAGSSAAQHA